MSDLKDTGIESLGICKKCMYYNMNYEFQNKMVFWCSLNIECQVTD